MIEDAEQFGRFIEWLPELQQDEVYFLSLSARNKYLTEEERVTFGLGRTEMFSRFTAHDKPGIQYVMQKLKASLLYRRTRSGNEIPTKALVTYMNVNPCSMIDAYVEFKGQIDNIMREMLVAHNHGKNGPSFEPWWKLERHLMNCVQRSKARRLIVDIDIDTHDPLIQGELCVFLSSHNIEHRLIKTQGGYHVLIKKETIGKTNIFSKIQELDARCEKEVVINKNGMVPVPGTLQAGKLVTFS